VSVDAGLVAPMLHRVEDTKDVGGNQRKEFRFLSRGNCGKLKKNLLFLP
jgi:hypothetical protein